MSYSTIGERLKKCREDRGMTQSELAKKLNIGEKTLRSYEKGQKVTVNFIEDFSNEFKIDSYWLIKGDNGQFSEPNGQMSDNTYSVAKLSIHASAGGGIENFNIEEIGQVLLDKELFRYAMNPKSLKIIQVQGDSMEPTITDGCHVVIDETQREKADAIYAFCLGGQILIKRLQFDHLNGTVIIRSDNPNYEDAIYNPKESQVPFRILGKKVLIIQ